MLSRLLGSSRRTQENHEVNELSQKGIESSKPQRDQYSRPKFLHLSKEEESKSRNFTDRPIITKTQEKPLPLSSGYAECINGGKSKENEDQAAVANFCMHNDFKISGSGDGSKPPLIDIHYFGIFDGHAGSGASLMAAEQLLKNIQEALKSVQEELFYMRSEELRTPPPREMDSYEQPVNIDTLVTGALESAFVAFDELLAQELKTFTIKGGTAALVVLVMLDRIFVAHAGDGRAVAYIGEESTLLATEFRPDVDLPRLQALVHLNPSATHGFFSEYRFVRCINQNDVGASMLCQAPHRTGWFYKEITEADITKIPLVLGQGKISRLAGVIGVTRGFGDYDLQVPGTDVPIKPLLTPIPEVRIMHLKDRSFQDEDVLVVGCDGLWDLVQTEEVGATVRASLEKSKEEGNSPHKYTQAADDVVHLARGDLGNRGWKMKDGQDASCDDISAFVIPLKNCSTFLAPEKKLSADA